MTVVVANDRLFLSVLQPRVAWDLGIMLVDLAVAMFPVVKLASTQLEPAQDPSYRLFGAVRSVIHIVEDFVPSVVGNPSSFQGSPTVFLV
jgi:hypothetical protein